MKSATVQRAFRVELDEVSALCLRAQPGEGSWSCSRSATRARRSWRRILRGRQERWKLPKGLEAGKERKAEGLVFDDEDRPLVALDPRDEHDNAFLLERLEE